MRNLFIAVTVIFSLFLLVGIATAGPPKDFLDSSFRGPVTDDVGTVSEFVAGIQGQKRWDKIKDGWVLRSVLTDEVAERKEKASFAFTKRNGHLYLSRIIMDGQELPSADVNLVVLDFGVLHPKQRTPQKKSTAAPTPDKKEPGILGLKKEILEAKFGQAKLTLNNQERQIGIFCVKGRYVPYVYDHEGNWETGKRERLGSQTIGPCSPNAASLLVMFDENNHVAASGYLTIHGNTYDRGWQIFLDNIIVGSKKSGTIRNAADVNIQNVTTSEPEVAKSTGPIDGTHAIQLPTGEKHVIFERVGDEDVMGRMALIWFKPESVVNRDWMELLKDKRIWGNL